MSSQIATLEPYCDGYVDPVYGNEITVSPRPKFPFARAPISDTFTRFYERDFEIVPRSIPRISARTSWTNLLTYSEDFENAAWTKMNVTVSANNRTAPNGEANMDKLLESSATGEHGVSEVVTVTAEAHEVSVFYRGGLTRTQIRLAFTDSAATTFSAIFTTAGNTHGAAANTTAKVTNLRDGYFRAVIRFTPAAGAGTFKVNLSTTGTTISYAGSTSAGMYVWGAQVTLGSLTPYISTLGTSRTILAPDRDPFDPFAFLLIESDPEPVNSHREIVRRTYGRIPRQQITPGSRPIPKPQIAGEFPRLINGVLVDQPDEETPEYTFYSQIPVTFDSGPPSFGITGGDYDVTVGAENALGIPYNANAATIDGLLDALGPIDDRGGVVVTGGPTQFNIQLGPYPTATADATGLTVSVGTATFAITYQTPGGAAAPSRNYVRFRMGSNGFITAGDFTITILGEETAAIAFDATVADVIAAVNALTVIGSGATVSIPSSNDYSGKPLSLSGNYIDFTVGIPFPSASADGSGLTPSGTATMTVNNGVVDGVPQFGWVLTLSSSAVGTRTLVTGGHTITAADDIILTTADGYVYLSAGQFTVPTSLTIGLSSASGAAFYGPTATAIGLQNGSRYAADSPDIAVELITDYYLPGVSPDIDVWTDIPIPSRVTPAQLLGAIFGGSTLANYEVGQISQYDETPILSITLTTINPQLLVSPDA